MLLQLGVEVIAVDLFVLDEIFCNLDKLILMLGKNLLTFVIGFCNDSLDFAVDKI